MDRSAFRTGKTTRRFVALVALGVLVVASTLLMGSTLGPPAPTGGGGGGAGIIDWTGASAITTGSAAAGGGTVDVNEGSFFDGGAVYLLTITAIGDTVSTSIRCYEDDGMSVGPIYEAVGIDAYTATYEDRIPWPYQDADGTAELHCRITNSGANASTYTLEILAAGE